MYIQMKVTNFRDLGGTLTQHNKKLKNNRILRSGELVNISPRAKDILTKKYELKKIIDMRGDQEINERPDDPFDSVDYKQIDILKDVTDDNASLEEFSQLTADAAHEHMIQLYHDLILTKGAQEGYQEFLQELLTTEEGSLLFHCFAGKDRTGIGAALALSLLDVPKQTIMEDYLLTNELRKEANYHLVQDAKQKGMTLPQLEGLRVSLGVHPNYLKTSYKIIEKEFGDVHSYVEKNLGFSKNDIQSLQQLYLED